MQNTPHLASESQRLANVRQWRRINAEFLAHRPKAKPVPVVVETDAATLAKYQRPVTLANPLPL